MRREARVLAVVPVEYYTRPVPLTRPKVWGVESFVGMRELEVRSRLRPDELFPPGGRFHPCYCKTSGTILILSELIV